MAILTGTLGNDDINGTNLGDLVLALTGDDVIIGRGGLDTIYGGDGNDVIYGNTESNWRDGEADILDGGFGDDIIYGEFGDIITGGGGHDVVHLDLRGATEAQVLDFRQVTTGIDIGLGDLIRIELPLGLGSLNDIEHVARLIGSDHNDVLRMANVGGVGSEVDAGKGDDTVRSMLGDNILRGEEGADFLSTGKGNDRLDGGVGNDRLFAGRGQDLLIGGAGKDIFIFADGDSSASRERADVIQDFTQAQGDKIDLTRMDANSRTADVDDAFTFIGTDKFSGTAGELRFVQVGADTFVVGDTDGDGKGDFTIELNGKIDLTVADFKL